MLNLLYLVRLLLLLCPPPTHTHPVSSLSSLRLRLCNALHRYTSLKTSLALPFYPATSLFLFSPKHRRLNVLVVNQGQRLTFIFQIDLTR